MGDNVIQGRFATSGDELFLQEAARQRQRRIARFPQPHNDNRVWGWPAAVPGRMRPDEEAFRSACELEARHPIALTHRFIAWVVAHALYALWLTLGRRRI